MDFMFWVWLGVIVVTAIIEFATMEIASIWFTFGAIVPFVMAACGGVHWAIQLAVFIVLSAVMILSLRRVTMKWFLKNSNHKTNVDALVGQKHRMLSRTDFETLGSVKINDVVWSAVGENQQIIEKDEIVEIVKVSGNKLIVKKMGKSEKLSENVAEKPQKTEEKVSKTAKNAVKTKKTEEADKDTQEPKVAGKAAEKPKTVAKKTTTMTKGTSNNTTKKVDNKKEIKE